MRRILFFIFFEMLISGRELRVVLLKENSRENLFVIIEHNGLMISGVSLMSPFSSAIPRMKMG